MKGGGPRLRRTWWWWGHKGLEGVSALVLKDSSREVAAELLSGKENAHKHKQNFPVTARVGGGAPDRVARGLPTGGQGSKVYVLCAEPKEYKHFRPGTRPGGLGTRREDQ